MFPSFGQGVEIPTQMTGVKTGITALDGNLIIPSKGEGTCSYGPASPHLDVSLEKPRDTVQSYFLNIL